MAQQAIFTKTLAAANATLLVGAVTPVSGTALTLSGSQPDTARRILVSYGNEAAPRTMVITGTNGSGTLIRETLTIPSGASGTVATNQDFLTVTQIMPLGGGWTAALTGIGTNTTGSSVWWIPNYHITPVEISADVEGTGTFSATVEYTDDTVLAPMPIYQTGYSMAVPIPNPIPWPGMSALTQNTTAIINRAASGIRLTINSGTVPVSLILRQAGIRN